ncbi:hypothetical protein DBR42_16160 [Pelomonas sp. HMWF004]|nr:hypothetical protein DBR42_16160 [Pelomonas sp. HMWF004]
MRLRLEKLKLVFEYADHAEFGQTICELSSVVLQDSFGRRAARQILQNHAKVVDGAPPHDFPGTLERDFFILLGKRRRTFDLLIAECTSAIFEMQNIGLQELRNHNIMKITVVLQLTAMMGDPENNDSLARNPFDFPHAGYWFAVAVAKS